MKRSPKGFKVRLAVAGVFFVALFLAVGVRAFQLQILQGEKLRRLGERQHLKEWTILPKRGTIFDRGGEPLALGLEAHSVYARPRRIEEPEAAARSLARALGLKVEEVEQKLSGRSPFVWLKRQISPKEAENVKSLSVEGVGMFYEPKRYYPQGRLAGQLIGFVGRDSQGLEGMERRYDAYLRGEAGSSVVERDALGRRVLVRGVEGLRMLPGADLQLSLDIAIQHLAEKELEETVKKFHAKAGSVIAVEPFTGEVLAMAHYPFFNPNEPEHPSSGRWRIRAITDSFEPGSTFKAILAAAALEEGVVEREDLFFCEFGKYAYGGKVIHDTRPHGWLSFAQIIQYSSNVCAVKVGEKLGKERYFRYIEAFGFGRSTGIDLPGEAAGFVRPPSAWSAVDLATHAFGQGIAVTPIQLVMAYGAIANGGFLMRPFIAQRAVGPGGAVLMRNQPHVVRRVISERTARTLTSVLRGVVSDGGTGAMANLEEFAVAGKTGTAQKPDLSRGGYAPGKSIASFIGFVPADEPRLVILVLIDEPEKSAYGGLVAAPAFRNIARGALRHLGVVPERGDPFLVPAGPAGLERRNGGGWRGDSSGVPDFRGLSLRQALGKASALKVPVELRGSGYVVSQSPAPGAERLKAGKLVLYLEG